MADDPFGQPMRAPEAPTEAAQLNAWLDAQLGRPLVLVALRRRADGNPLASWRAQAQQFAGVQLLEETASDEPIAETLARIARRDPDALLVCDDARAGASEDAEDAEDAEAATQWRAALLDAAEGGNFFERMEIALVGAGMTRASARSRGFEDGFATDQPLAEALAILAREAVTRATFRRYGSSPPCYL